MSMESGLGTYVTYNPHSVSLETRVDDLLRMVEDLKMRHFPVVDEEQRLIGVIEEADLVQLAGERRQSRLEESDPLERVAQIVSSDLVTVAPSTSPKQALRLLMETHIHSLPVVEEGKLIGVVTATDFLREFSYGQMTCAKEPLSEFLSRPAEPLEPDANLEETLAAMDREGVDYLAVVQGGCPVGIVSRRDVAQDFARRSQQQAASNTSVLKILRKTPALRPGQRMNEAAALMLETGLGALAVTNQANRFLGILTDDDILKVMLRELK
jgi:CBS domain-containing protein